jgi:hypothetical protein
MPELEVRSLTKRYGSTVAVDDLSFAVEAGRVTGRRDHRRDRLLFHYLQPPYLLPGSIGDYFPAASVGALQKAMTR